MLEEFGLTLPVAKKIRVWDSTAELRYLVIPERPADTEGWSEERLAELETRYPGEQIPLPPYWGVLALRHAALGGDVWRPLAMLVVLGVVSIATVAVVVPSDVVSVSVVSSFFLHAASVPARISAVARATTRVLVRIICEFLAKPREW